MKGQDQPLEITELDLADPKDGEVMVRLGACGVCHSDLSAVNGTLPAMTPCVLGHEGAGVVEKVGPGVTSVGPGDHVVLSWVPQCGRCYTCLRGQPQLCEMSFATALSGGLLDGTSRFSLDGLPVYQMTASGCFTEYTTVPSISVVKVDPDMPFDKAALLGCGVLTGMGAVRNTARVEEGATVAVIGTGGVGLSVILGAKLAGAAQIIAVDISADKLELAEGLGATDVVDASAGNPVAAVQALTGTTPAGMPRGVDYAFEVVGSAPTVEQALMMTRRGGTAVAVGVPRMDATINLSLFAHLFLNERRLVGCVYGSSNVQRDVQLYADLYMRGRLDLDALVSRTIPLDDVNGAFDAIEKGEVARSVIVFDG
jgi:Zn-dependent alcohol dehydrogenase